jgi:hypothetical protein
MDAVRSAALIHSPLMSAATWGELPAALSELGWTVTVTEVLEDEPPFASRFVARTAQQLMLANPSEHLTLIGHGAAGPLLPQIAFARQAAGCPVSSYVFVDAHLPRTLRAGTLLDVIEAADPVAGAELAQQLSDGGTHPNWSDRELVASMPRAADRALVLASVRPHGLDFFTEMLPLPEDWPDAPCSYVQLSDPYQAAARIAAQRGWPVRSVDAHHFCAVTDPSQLAAAVTDLHFDRTGS